MKRILFTVEEQSARTDSLEDVEYRGGALRQRRIFIETIDGLCVPIDVEPDDPVSNIPIKVYEKEPFLHCFAASA